jgi:hypothetical protein
MPTKFSVLAVSWRQTIPRKTLFKQPLTHIDKNALCAAMGVPEFWRFNGQVWRIYQMQGGGYGSAIEQYSKLLRYLWVGMKVKTTWL